MFYSRIAARGWAPFAQPSCGPAEHCCSAQAACAITSLGRMGLCPVCGQLLVLVAPLPSAPGLCPRPAPDFSSAPNGACCLLSMWLWPPKSRMAAFGVQAIWCADVRGYAGNDCILCLVVLVGLISSYKVNNFTLISIGAAPQKSLKPVASAGMVE